MIVVRRDEIIIPLFAGNGRARWRWRGRKKEAGVGADHRGIDCMKLLSSCVALRELHLARIKQGA